jgi:hypothetical protein
MTMKVIEGSLASEHWLLARNGAERILIAVCHFVDLVCFLPGSSTEYFAVGGSVHDSVRENHHAAVSRNGDGPTYFIAYTASRTSRRAPNRFEAHGGGDYSVCDDLRRRNLLRGTHVSAQRVGAQDVCRREEALVAFTVGMQENAALVAKSVCRTAATLFCGEAICRRSSFAMDGPPTWN